SRPASAAEGDSRRRRDGLKATGELACLRRFPTLVLTSSGSKGVLSGRRDPGSMANPDHGRLPPLTTCPRHRGRGEDAPARGGMQDRRKVSEGTAAFSDPYSLAPRLPVPNRMAPAR